MPLAEPKHEHTNYEIERNKPMPSLKAIAVYTKADHYQFFSSDMILHDKVLDIELPLQTIFGLK